MPIFSKYSPKNEKELHGIIEKEIDSLEEELRILKYEFSTGKGNLDFLCADSGGRLTIIEVKLSEDDNVLFQGLRYFSLMVLNGFMQMVVLEVLRLDLQVLLLQV